MIYCYFILFSLFELFIQHCIAFLFRAVPNASFIHVLNGKHFFLQSNVCEEKKMKILFSQLIQSLNELLKIYGNFICFSFVLFSIGFR